MSLFNRKSNTAVLEPETPTRTELVKEAESIRAHRLDEHARLAPEKAAADKVLATAKAAYDTALRAVQTIEAEQRRVNDDAGRRLSMIERQLLATTSPLLNEAIEAVADMQRSLTGYSVRSQFSAPDGWTIDRVMNARSRLEELRLLDLSDDEIVQRIAAIEAGE